MDPRIAPHLFAQVEVQRRWVGGNGVLFEIEPSNRSNPSGRCVV